MLRLAADENFNNRIVRGLSRRSSDLDIIRIQDAGLTGADDPTVLAWCANEDRILLTHDVSTITKYALDRINASLFMPGVFEVDDGAPIGKVIDDLLLLAECSDEGEWIGQIQYLPF